jgi:hypothetical protein
LVAAVLALMVIHLMWVVAAEAVVMYMSQAHHSKKTQLMLSL